MGKYVETEIKTIQFESPPTGCRIIDALQTCTRSKGIFFEFSPASRPVLSSGEEITIKKILIGIPGGKIEFFPPDESTKTFIEEAPYHKVKACLVTKSPIPHKTRKIFHSLCDCVEQKITKKPGINSERRKGLVFFS